MYKKIYRYNLQGLYTKRYEYELIPFREDDKVSADAGRYKCLSHPNLGEIYLTKGVVEDYYKFSSATEGHYFFSESKRRSFERLLIEKLQDLERELNPEDNGYSIDDSDIVYRARKYLEL